VQHVRAREISKLAAHLEIPRDGLGSHGVVGAAGYIRLNGRGTQVRLGFAVVCAHSCHVIFLAHRYGEGIPPDVGRRDRRARLPRLRLEHRIQAPVLPRHLADSLPARPVSLSVRYSRTVEFPPRPGAAGPLRSCEVVGCARQPEGKRDSGSADPGWGTISNEEDRIYQPLALHTHRVGDGTGRGGSTSSL
jgi:hypothetical protein